MNESVIARQFVEFAERGFSTVKGVLAEFQRRLFEAKRGADLLKEALDSGAYQRVAQQIAASHAQLDQLNAQARRIDLENRFGKVGAAVVSANEKFGQLNTVVRQAVGIIVGPAAAAFGLLTGSVMGFVRAGLQGSVEGFRLQFAFGQLSKEIAGIFLPVVEKVTQWVEKVTNWFRRLTGMQQDFIMKAVVVAAVMLAVTVAIGGMIVGIVGLIAAVLNLAAAMTALDITLAGIPLLIGVIVTALAAMAGVATAGGGAMMVMSQNGTSLMEKFGNAVQGVWDRIKPLIDATTNWWRILGRLFEIGQKLGDALVRPFAKLYDRLTGGRSPLEVFADVLDRMANFIDDYITPAFDALAIVLEDRLTKALTAMGDLIEAAASKAGRLFELLSKVSPLLYLAGKFYEHTRASPPDDKHRRPMPMDTGFESAEGTWRRIAQSVAKFNITQEKSSDQRTAESVEQVNGIVDELNKRINKFLDTIQPLLDGIAASGGMVPVKIIASLLNALR